MTTKAELRATLKFAVTGLSPSEREQASAKLCDRLNALTCSSLGIYLALPDEPNLLPAYQALLNQGNSLALAYPESDTNWSFHQILTLEVLETGTYGLRYPQAKAKVVAEDLDVILVPGMGFTTDGHRLGRGKGIYDRLLANTTAKKIGICFSCQLVEDLPTEPWDIRMDEVWTA